MPYQGLDNQIYRSLPEGVSINIIPAGIAARSSAFLVDFLIRTVIFIACGFALNAFDKAGQGMFLLVYFSISWGYNIYFESLNGQTPGKKKFKLRVVQDNGLPAQLNQIVLRNLLRAADAFPFAYVIGLIVMAFGKEYKRIGDWTAGTIVVYDQPTNFKSNSGEQNSSAPPFNLSTQEQQAVLAFADRSNELSTARQEELANILADSLGVTYANANEKLKEIAHYYAGQAV